MSTIQAEEQRHLKNLKSLRTWMDSVEVVGALNIGIYCGGLKDWFHVAINASAMLALLSSRVIVESIISRLLDSRHYARIHALIQQAEEAPK